MLEALVVVASVTAATATIGRAATRKKIIVMKTTIASAAFLDIERVRGSDLEETLRF